MFGRKIEETGIKREATIKEIAEFLRKLLPKNTLHQQVTRKINPANIGEKNPRRPEKIGPRLSLDLDLGEDIHVETPKKLPSKLKTMMKAMQK